MIRGRARAIVLGAVALLAVLALVLPALHDLAVRAYALDIPDALPVATLHRGQQACEGQVTSDHRYRAAGVWASSKGGPATFSVSVQTVAHHVLAAGAATVGPAQTESVVALDRVVTPHRPVVVCVTERTGTGVLWGSPPTVPGVTATGVTPTDEFSLVLVTDPGDGSLLHWLPTAFARASLWRPSWVGGWTFWVLAVALLGSFGLGVLTVLRAADADEAAAPTPVGEEARGSETREDSPQPVP